jgi:hypothetical protein
MKSNFVLVVLSAVATLVPASVVQRNQTLDRRLRRHNMTLGKWKALKNGMVSVLVLGFASFAILQGAPVGATALLALAIVGTMNGLDYAEFIASKTDDDE